MLNKPSFKDPARYESLDRQSIVAVRKRFLSINEKRLQRMRAALSERQHIFLDALPILFHSNHPMLPGFVSRNTPSGLSNFKPSKEDIQYGRMVARSFTLGYTPDKEEQIYGIYIMGSVGTIAQSDASDLDIWLCHQPGLGHKALKELEQKTLLISQWAETLGLEAHFFLMDSEAFKRGGASDLNEESSGSAQKFLLLDEFYRASIFMGGRIPLWWFTPDEIGFDYNGYAHTLLHKRFVNESLTLDFGSVAKIPDGEFIGAGIWQLYKAIESPYKSVLKLLLLEAYVSDYPDIKPLSLNYKDEIYSGNIDIESLDSYVMIYRRIEHYLKAHGETERLELARRCFYVKVKKNLSKAPKKGKDDWQYALMAKLTEEWGWTHEHLAIMDQRSQWKSLRVAEERSLLVNQLNYSYAFILDFANRIGASRAISSEELTILGRKLQAAFERRPGKIEWINPNISKNLNEDIVVFKEVFDDSTNNLVWTAYTHEDVGTAISQNGTAIKSSNSLIELTLWCHLNGVVTASTRFDIISKAKISRQEVQRIFSALTNWLPLPLESLPHDTFKKAASPARILFLINVGQKPASDIEANGYQRLSEHNDALRYGGFQTNLITSVDIVNRNSWNELSTRRFDGDNALLDAMLDYLQMCLPGTHQKPPTIAIKCISTLYSSTIINRVQSLFTELLTCYYGKGATAESRYIFQMADAYYSLQFRGMKPRVSKTTSADLMIDSLSAEQTKYSQIILDSSALKTHPVRYLLNKCQPNAVDVFFSRFDIGMEIYISDENGSLFHQIYRGHNNNPLKVLHHFLRAVTQRQIRNSSTAPDFGIYPIHFYELENKRGGNAFSCTPRTISTELDPKSKFDVRAIAHLDNSNNLHFDFYCDDQEFSAMSFGDQLDLVVAQFITARRMEREHYPIYITDMDLSLATSKVSENGKLQVVHYLRQKTRLELRLNQAIGVLINA